MPPEVKVEAAKEAGHTVFIRELKGAGYKAEIEPSLVGGARGFIVLDEEALYISARTHASFEELGLVFGVDATQLSKHPYYRAIVDRARADRRMDLRSAQFRNAIDNDNAVMQIWLGKQHLDQKDVSRVEQTGKDGQPQEHVVTRRVTASIPDNGRDAHAPDDELPPAA